MWSLFRSRSSGPIAEPSSSAPEAIGTSLIPIVNKVEEIFGQLGSLRSSSTILGSSSTIDLPHVAVVGSLNSGKSSLLEALVGLDFLPHGPEMCTRRPLVIKLVNIARNLDAPAGEESWGEFSHFPWRRFYQFSEIRSEIQAQTDLEAGRNKGVSDKKIVLKIFSPNVLSITLVDLPGITNVPVGDQPSNIEAIIRKMIKTYIKHETCIILVVSPANEDLSNSDALQMARSADPNGFRTIGVVTKLDIMDRVVDTRNILRGNVIPLKLGYVGVVNRSQQDINLNRSIKDALANEEAFFKRQPVYHGLSHCCGVPKLAENLNQILVQHIQSLLPKLKSRINSKLMVVAKEHAAYGNVVKSKAEQRMKLLNIFTKYCEAFNSMIEEKKEELLIEEPSVGAQIHYIFRSFFLKNSKEVDPCDDISDEDIRMAIQHVADRGGALLVPEVPFEVLVRRLIDHLLCPSLQCANFIYDEMIKMSQHSFANELRQYPFLRNCMDEVIRYFLQEGLQRVETGINNLIELQMDYINISHPDFIGENKAVEIAQQQIKASRLATSIFRPKLIQKLLKTKSASNKTVEIAQQLKALSLAASGSRPKPPVILKPSENQSEQKALEISITKLLLKSYYDIVRKQIEDIVLKTIMHYMVNHTKRQLHNDFMKKLNKEDLFDDLFQEPGDIDVKRKISEETSEVLQQACKALEELQLEMDAMAMCYSQYPGSQQLSSS